MLGLNELLAATAHEVQGQKRDEIEQQDADLVDSHAAVVDCVKCWVGEPEPATMECAQPLARRHEHDEPDQQDCVVDGKRAEQEAEKEIRVHEDLLLWQLTPELSRTDLRPRQWHDLTAISAAAKRSRLERIVRLHLDCRRHL